MGLLQKRIENEKKLVNKAVSVALDFGLKQAKDFEQIDLGSLEHVESWIEEMKKEFPKVLNDYWIKDAVKWFEKWLGER